MGCNKCFCFVLGYQSSRAWPVLHWPKAGAGRTAYGNPLEVDPLLERTERKVLAIRRTEGRSIVSISDEITTVLTVRRPGRPAGQNNQLLAQDESDQYSLTR